MTNPPTDAVVAGTKNFAVALLAPLTARVGVRPRIAADAGQALALCGGPGGLVVIEYVGDASRPGIEQLVRAGGLRIVAGVPEVHAAAEPSLRALGIETARWDGRPDAVLVAVERQISVAPAPRAAAPAPAGAAPAAAAPKPAAPTAAAGRPAPAPTAAKAAAAPAASARPAAAPAAPAAKPAAPQKAPTPAASAPRPAVPAAAGPARPAAAQGVSAAATAGARPPAAAPPAAAKAVPVAPQPAPRAAAIPAPVPPAAPAPPPAAPAAQPPAPAPATGRHAGAAERTSPDTAALFDGVPGDDPFLSDGPVDVEVDEAIAAIEPSAPVLYAPPPASGAAAGADWPASAPGSAEAEAALVAALTGGAEVAGLGAVAAHVASALSDLEREILAGGRPPVDAEAIRRAAVMRVRVGAALASVPPRGSRVDAGAVHAFLGEIDALLSAVAALAGTAPEALHPSLEAVRNALVKEAIDFSEAAQRIAPAAPVAQEAPRPSARAAQTRVLSVSATRDTQPRRYGVWIMLVLALVAAGGYHGYRYASHQRAVARLKTIPGAPDGMVLTVGGPGTTTQLLMPLRGIVPDRGQVERFKAAKEAEGYQVRELAGGSLELRPRPAPGRQP
ncbi:hypothetical protein [Anaeromyxobacter oryzae]|uniref:Uncharacterized protein n=1 Tax=Anaeromyxobacter oryzae TaxID=2918170 RepID=A0ABM7WXU7_9BACT|nr:hypothetical protein [Anaeromyxobacter oryzae]BDG04349.1 hypothetical protein AMOR_33450 [Anaeromyxobacter oryzae]